MADKFGIEPIRQVDAKGRLIAAGVRWKENRDRLHAMLATVAVFAFFGLLTAFVFLAVTPQAGWPGDLALWSGAGLLGCFALGFLYGKAPRELIFDADGRVTVPHGLAQYPDLRQFRMHHDDIASIEKCNAVCVAVYTVEGDAYAVALGLNEWSSRKVAVQLSNALRDIRDAASMPQHARRAGAARHGRAVPGLID